MSQMHSGTLSWRGPKWDELPQALKGRGMVTPPLALSGSLLTSFLGKEKEHKPGLLAASVYISFLRLLTLL